MEHLLKHLLAKYLSILHFSMCFPVHFVDHVIPLYLGLVRDVTPENMSG